VIDTATWVAIVGPITTLLGGLGGYWLAGRNDEARDERATAREERARRAALAERLEEDRHTFQRDTLLELQDGLQRLARVTTRIILQDQKTLNERGQVYLLPEGFSDESHQVVITIQRLRTRLLDAGLRQAVGDFVGLCSRDAVAVAHLPKEEALGELGRQDGKLSAQYVALNELLGEHLRRELDRRSFAVEQRPVDGTARDSQP
jgi:hypothetical protein